MKGKLFFSALMLWFISYANLGFATNKPNNYFSYSPDGKVNFNLCETQILIKFLPNVNFEDQARLLKSESLLQALTKDMLLPAPKVTVAKKQIKTK